MKKTFALAALLAVTMTAFTGCGGMSQEELDSNAQTLYDAAATALVEMDANAMKLPTGIIDSDGKVGSNSDFTAIVYKYFSGLEDEKLEWVVYINENDKNGTYVEYACLAESYDSKTVGKHGEKPSGETLNDIIRK